MMLIAGVTAAILLALLTADYRWRPLALGGAFALRIGLPTIVDYPHEATLGLHASTILVLVLVIVWAPTTRTSSNKTRDSAPRIPLLCHMALLIVVIGTIITAESLLELKQNAAFAMNQMVAPYVMCMLIYNTSLHHKSLQKSAGRLFTLICVFQAIIAVAVYFEVIVQPFLSFYPKFFWSRQSATLDHPLVLGLLLAAGVPMTMYLRSRFITYCAILIIGMGIGLTQSRIAIFGAAAGLLYIFTIGSKSLSERITLLVTLGIGYVLVNDLKFFQELIGRFQYDDGSSETRAEAAQLFIAKWNDFKFTGVGIHRQKDYFLSNGLRASGESAAVSYAVGLGIPITLLFFSLIIWLIGRGIRQANFLSPASVSAIIAFASIQFFGSISSESAAAMILWVTIGIALVKPDTELRSGMHDIDATVPGATEVMRQPHGPPAGRRGG